MSKPTVLFAINESSRKQFLPHYNRKALPAFKEEWVEVGRLKGKDWEKLLLAKQPDVLISCWETPRIPDDLILKKKLRLRYANHLTGTVKGLVSRDLIEHGLLVSNWGSTISHTIAEHALLLTLASLRRIKLWESHMSSHNTMTAISARSLRGKKIGIHGFGAIARHLISLLKPFGVTISAYSAGVPVPMFAEHGVRRCKSLEELVKGIDVMIECEALTPQTKGSVNARILAQLPKDAVFVNVGRGAVIDEVALAKLAVKGKINVGLDVYQKEPLPLNSPLQNRPNVLLSPHIAGPTHDAFPLCGDNVLSNLKHYLSGQKDQIKGIVTLEIYDRTT